jgi:hypothetical protein
LARAAKAAQRTKKGWKTAIGVIAHEIGMQGVLALHVRAIIPVQNPFERQSKEDRDGQTYALSRLAVALVGRALDA